MTFRLRLIASVVASLLISVAFGGLLTWWTARNSVTNELSAALAVGEQTVRATLDRLPRSTEPRNDLLRLVATFDRDRHLRVVLRGDGTWEFASTPATEPGDVPEWFIWALVPPQRELQIPLPAVDPALHEIAIEPDPRNEVLEVWNSSREGLIGTVAACALTSLLVWWSMGHAVRPFTALARALGSIRFGQYHARLDLDGPVELKQLSQAFNHMAAELEAVRSQNRSLNQELVTLQDRERSELARDLHDEVGPFLLAVNIDAAAIDAALKDGRHAEIPELVASIRDSVGHMQRHVRAALNRLRPIGLQEFGLVKAIENLVEFWRRRHPDIAIACRIDAPETGFGELIDPTVYRVVQEGLANALRHARPTRIAITLTRSAGAEPAVSVAVSDDGEGSERPTLGFGLTGMRDRIAAVGGRLTLGNRPAGGFAISAWLPLPAPAAPQPEAAEAET